ncbi:MAG: ferritin [Spirochaetales bacterium]|nr:ferritin [Spirochaetales bacterium]
MLNKKLITLMNEQINKEFYSAYLYLDFANIYEEKGLLGFANWNKVQAHEEIDHGMLIYRYLQDNNAEITLMTIEAPNVKHAEAINGADIKGEKLLGLLKAALKHEEYITSLINNMYCVAQELKDYKTMQFLDWFVKEQGEEEGSLQNLLIKTQLFGSDSSGLYTIDNELAARTYMPLQ